jgi:hypothetical protein
VLHPAPFLFGQTDPMLAATVAMLIGVALARSSIPARGPIRLDPAAALNTE